MRDEFSEIYGEPIHRRKAAMNGAQSCETRSDGAGSEEVVAGFDCGSVGDCGGADVVGTELYGLERVEDLCEAGGWGECAAEVRACVAARAGYAQVSEARPGQPSGRLQSVTTLWSAMIGVFLGFAFGIGCALAVMYSIYRGGYRAAVRDSRILPVPERYRKAIEETKG